MYFTTALYHKSKYSRQRQRPTLKVCLGCKLNSNVYIPTGTVGWLRDKNLLEKTECDWILPVKKKKKKNTFPNKMLVAAVWIPHPPFLSHGLWLKISLHSNCFETFSMFYSHESHCRSHNLALWPTETSQAIEVGRIQHIGILITGLKFTILKNLQNLIELPNTIDRS